MGSGKSGLSSGGGGATIENAISNAVAGNFDVSEEERADIASNRYGLDSSKLSSADRKVLSDIFPESADSIKNGNVVQIKIGNLSTEQLKDIVRLSAKIRTYASNFCMEDALKMISYWQNFAVPF